MPIASLRPGDLVYSVDRGEVTVVPIDAVQQIAAPRGHVVQRVVLSTGSVLEISAPHPTADGRTFGDLRAGNLLDGVEIRAVTAIAYRYDQTYDILPASDSAAYFANGVLIKSAMASRSATVREPTTPFSR